MQTRNNGKQAAEERRDLDLENIIGNLFIAEYQVDRLRTRLARLAYSYEARMSNDNNKASTHVFKHNNKWYKISLMINETDATLNKDGQDYITGYSSKR
jgi:hypothetical protein